MKKLLITIAITIAGILPATAQLVVHDVVGELTQLLTSADQVGVATENLNSMLESVEKSSKMLELAQEGVDKLREVSKEIKLYAKVTEILQYSIKTGNLYYKLGRVLIQGKFSDIVKVKHLSTLYSMFCKSTEYVVEVNHIISDKKFEMNDAERMQFIDKLYEMSSRNYSNMSLYSQKLISANYYRNALDNDYNLLKQLRF